MDLQKHIRTIVSSVADALADATYQAEIKFDLEVSQKGDLSGNTDIICESKNVTVTILIGKDGETK